VVVVDYEIKPQSFPFFPLDWSQIFGRKSKIVVEIGFGNGEFLAEMARKYPEKDFVGFEVSITSFVKAQKKFKKYGLTNVKLVKVDGRFGLRELFPDNSVEKVYVNFPCPWPKKRHENRRITSHDFMQTLSAVLEMDGTLEFATDEEWYAKEVREAFDTSEYFVVDSFVENFQREVETRYERKWKSQGKRTFLIIARKIRHGAVKRLLEGKNTVAHVTFEGTVSWEKLKSLEGKVFKNKNKVFVVKRVYRDSGYLLKVISTDEGDFRQIYYLDLSGKNGRWILKLDDGSDPYRTPAMKWSLRKIAEELTT